MAKGKTKERMRRWMLRMWGGRCKDYNKDCPLCKAWKAYDYLFEYAE